MTPSPAPDRRAIGVIGAYVEGWRRVLRAPAMWAGLSIATVLADIALGGISWGFLAAPRPDGAEATPALALRALFFVIPRFDDSLTITASAVAAKWTPNLLAAVACHLGLSTFLWGGVLDRLARSRRIGSAAFFAACGVYLWRFLRLAAVVVLAYAAVERWLRPEVSVLTTTAALVILMTIADVARLRAVVEDRHSMLSALAASLRFIRRHALALIGLYALNLVAVAALVAAYVMGTHGVTTLLLFAAWVSAFVWARLVLAASEVVYFQHALAHADYTAAPLPIWPDSPAAEAIENLTRVGPKLS